MNKNIIVLVLCLAAIAGAAYSQFSPDTIGSPGTHGQAATFATSSLSTTVASTTAVTVSDLTGRDYIEIRCGPIADQAVWVGIDTTPTISIGSGTGICVTAASPLKLNIPAGTVVKTIASGAWPMSVYQAAY